MDTTFSFVVRGLDHEQLNQLLLEFIARTEDAGGEMVGAGWVEGDTTEDENGKKEIGNGVDA